MMKIEAFKADNGTVFERETDCTQYEETELTNAFTLKKIEEFVLSGDVDTRISTVKYDTEKEAFEDVMNSFLTFLKSNKIILAYKNN